MDIGSSMTKVVIIDDTHEILIRKATPTGARHSLLARKVFDDALSAIDLSPDSISYVLATGYGRVNVPFAHRHMSEITCQAAGVHALFPKAKTIIDIGGQDAKGVKLVDGRVIDFIMNDKCAAGTGRFLEVLSDSLDIPLADFGHLSLQARTAVEINNFCTVFARDELTACISRGRHIHDIIAGVHDAIAMRVVNMVNRLKIEPEVVFTAGLATNTGMVRAIENHIGFPVSIPDHPFTTVALGAAILARKIWLKDKGRGKS